jgi:hypothetical protein
VRIATTASVVELPLLLPKKPTERMLKITCGFYGQSSTVLPKGLLLVPLTREILTL